MARTDMQAEQREGGKKPVGQSQWAWCTEHWEAGVPAEQDEHGEEQVCYSGLFFCFCNNPDQNQLGEERVHFSSHNPSSRKSEAGTEAKVMEESCSLACFLWLTQLPYTAQSQLPRDGATHSGLGSPTPIRN